MISTEETMTILRSATDIPGAVEGFYLRKLEAVKTFFDQSTHSYPWRILHEHLLLPCLFARLNVPPYEKPQWFAAARQIAKIVDSDQYETATKQAMLADVEKVWVHTRQLSRDLYRAIIALTMLMKNTDHPLVTPVDIASLSKVLTSAENQLSLTRTRPTKVHRVQRRKDDRQLHIRCKRSPPNGLPYRQQGRHGRRVRSQGSDRVPNRATR